MVLNSGSLLGRRIELLFIVMMVIGLGEVCIWLMVLDMCFVM